MLGGGWYIVVVVVVVYMPFWHVMSTQGAQDALLTEP